MLHHTIMTYVQAEYTYTAISPFRSQNKKGYKRQAHSLHNIIHM